MSQSGFLRKLVRREGQQEHEVWQGPFEAHPCSKPYMFFARSAVASGF